LKFIIFLKTFKIAVQPKQTPSQNFKIKDPKDPKISKKTEGLELGAVDKLLVGIFVG
jgi:hypothetical protein